MTYRSDREITESLIPSLLFRSVVHYGHNEPDSAEAKQLIAWLEEAMVEELQGLMPKKADALLRRAYRMHEEIIAPFREAETAVAKFGLISYYLLDKLRENGLFQVIDGTPLDKAFTALLNEDGTLVEYANITKIDQSAQKQARHMLASLQAHGFYKGAVW